MAITTPSWIILGSDRRLSNPETGKRIQIEATKHIYSYGNLVLGYTGVAFIGGKPTDEWTIETLQGVDPQNQINYLQEKATLAIAAMRSRPHLKNKRLPLEWLVLAFMQNERGSYVPCVMRVTNFHLKDGTETSQDSIRFMVHGGPKKGVQVHSTGVPVPAVFMRTFRAHVVSTLRADPNDIKGIVHVLIGAMANIARHPNNSEVVGTDYIVTCFPKAARNKQYITSWLRDDPLDHIELDEVSALFFRSAGGPAVAHKPALVTSELLIHGSVMALASTAYPFHLACGTISKKARPREVLGLALNRNN